MTDDNLKEALNALTKSLPKHYILNGRLVAEESDTLKWAIWFVGHHDERIVKQDFFGEIKVSTVFLGLDHNYFDGEPHLFETMIFGGKHNEECKRCSTWEQAETQHETACEYFK